MVATAAVRCMVSGAVEMMDVVSASGVWMAAMRRGTIDRRSLHLPAKFAVSSRQINDLPAEILILSVRSMNVGVNM